jgi:calcineurin-like phosphoesterase
MTGPFLSVIGVVKEDAIHRFLTQMPHKLDTASQGARLNGALIDVDSETGKARRIERVCRS